ncbi:MAG: elongation factor Ts [Ichthyobacteriaceae bacterium]|nr:elongation factor Ts [Ichthyobacteriaceae bacterium]
MAKITAAEVNKLRKQTGAGMMDCKKALVEAEGDFNQAIDLLRKQGQKVAAKRADRENTEGAAIAVLSDDKTKGAVISLFCETDFVAINDSYVALAKSFADLALKSSASNLEEFLASDYAEGQTVAEKLIEQTGVMGEKLEIKDFAQLEGALIGAYIHAGNKIAVLTQLSANVEGAEVVAKDVAMQAAAMNPIALDESGVDSATIEKEIEIAKDQLRQEGKPEAMLDNIAKGKIKKFFKDNTLINQSFIKDNKQTIAQYVKTIGDVKVENFVRIGIGA